MPLEIKLYSQEEKLRSALIHLKEAATGPEQGVKRPAGRDWQGQLGACLWEADEGTGQDWRNLATARACAGSIWMLYSQKK